MKYDVSYANVGNIKLEKSRFQNGYERHCEQDKKPRSVRRAHTTVSLQWVDQSDNSSRWVFVVNSHGRIIHVRTSKTLASYRSQEPLSHLVYRAIKCYSIRC